jgi:hypothetical protein
MQVQSTVAAKSVADNTNFDVAFSSTSSKPVKAAAVVVQLNRVNLKTLISQQDGRFVSVDFLKLDGQMRTLTGRLGVKSYLRGGANNVEAADRPYLTMFDVQLRQYRTVNLSSVSELRAAGKVFRVID